jgi:SMODS and SLOG-associating 2TM effector domain 2
MSQMQDDLEHSDLGELNWSLDQRSKSLSSVFDHATAFSRDAEQWYARKRSAKRRYGRALRVGSILLGALAAVIPIVSEIYPTGAGAIAPGWSAVALAAAATFVGLDRYFGFSSAWMRYMAAELKLAQVRTSFEYMWQLKRATTADPPTDDDLAILLEDAHTFVSTVNELISEETRAWITEFRTALTATEHATSGGNRN